MSTRRFRVLNVFTREQRCLTGNPLCVVEDAADLDAPTMQALARQFNLSETTFVLPSARAQARLRIFSPNYELPFAGHPILGTAHVCRALNLGGNTLRLETQAALITVEAQGNRWTLTAPEPTWREFEANPATLAEGLNLDERDIGDRPLWVSTGTEQLLIPLVSEDAVRRAAPQIHALGAMRNEVGLAMIYVFALKGSSETSARFFFSQDSIMLEDPATGSATANFGGWCLAMQRRLPLSYEISQGEMIGRPSSLYLDIDAERRIRVGGDVIEIAAGELTLS